MNVNSKKIWLGLVGCAFLLSACNHYAAKTNEKIETVLERVEDYSQRATIPDLPSPVDTVRMQNDIWLGDSSVKIMEGDALPAHLEEADSVTLSISTDKTLPLLAQELTDLTGIVVRLDDLKVENAVSSSSDGKTASFHLFYATDTIVAGENRNDAVEFDLTKSIAEFR